MALRGVRGATTTDRDEPGAILAATQELLQAIQAANPSLAPGDVASVLFTTTPDLRAEYPAKAARQIGWDAVPLMCA
jgi:chorismate mutase